MTENTMLTRDIKFSASLVLSLTLAVGMLLGGLGTALLVVYNKIHIPTVFGTASILYCFGAAIGLGYGFALAAMSSDAPLKDTFKDIGNGWIYLIPSLLIGWIITELAAMLPVALMRGIPNGLTATISSVAMWIVDVVVVAFAGSVTWHSLVKIWKKVM